MTMLHARPSLTRPSIALTNDDLRKAAPSVFAESAWGGTSGRYCHVPTIEVVNILRDRGYSPVLARQSACRIDGKENFVRHMLRFRHSDYMGPLSVGAEIPELVLSNSHDGTSAYRFASGVFRLVCLNGMVVASADHGSMSVRHQGGGEFAQKVIEASYRIAEDAPKVAAQIDEWKSIPLGDLQQKAFAEAAAELLDNPSIKPASLLEARRPEDRPSVDGSRDLWRTFNTVQEAIVKGGVKGWNAEKRRRTKTRPITSVDRDIKLNRALWTLGEKMAGLMA